jgi:hypothetical protein
MTENNTLFSGGPKPFLHFENISDAPEDGGLRWCILSSGYERGFFDKFVCLGSLTVSVPDEDSYSIFSEGELRGFSHSSRSVSCTATKNAHLHSNSHARRHRHGIDAVCCLGRSRDRGTPHF